MLRKEGEIKEREKMALEETDFLFYLPPLLAPGFGIVLIN